MDDPHFHSAGTAAGIRRPLSIHFASKLYRGRRRDYVASDGSGSTAARRRFHGPQRGSSRDPHQGRESRPRNNDARRPMKASISGSEQTRAATWLGFVLMCVGMFMAILDIQVVATSLPSIQHALAISRDAMSWIQTAYLIAEVIAIPLTGWLTRVLTLRWLFVIAIVLFTIASIGCAFSGSFAILVGFRVLQGFAGGVLIPAVFSAVFLLFPIRLHPVATTMAGIMAVLAPTVGPVVGGWITDN